MIYIKYPSRWGWRLKVIKNWDPFVSGPEFAMHRRPGPSCFSLKFSSADKMVIGIINHELTHQACINVVKAGKITGKLSSIYTFSTSACKPIKNRF